MKIFLLLTFVRKNQKYDLIKVGQYLLIHIINSDWQKFQIAKKYFHCLTVTLYKWLNAQMMYFKIFRSFWVLKPPSLGNVEE